MDSPDGRYSVTYNGEITNYKEIAADLAAIGVTFRSHSDTEVLLASWAQWGAAALDRFEGMYAFALVDRELDTLTLARDVFGIKPIFYSERDDLFAFNSEIGGLLELLPGRPRLDWQAALDYLQWNAYDISTRTFIDGVSQLMPAHYLTVDLATGRASEPVRYWWPAVATTPVSSSEAVDTVRSLFLDSVSRNLRSDVPVGIALSGGVDSSAIAGAVHHLDSSYPIQAFSFVTPGYAKSEDSWIEMVAKATDARTHFVSATADEMYRDLDEMIIAQGEPFRSTSIYAQYRVFKLARENGVVVTLDGQGADEVFAGYSGYPSHRLMSLIERGHLRSAVQFLSGWSEWPGRSGKEAALGTASLFVPRPIARAAARVVARKALTLDYAALAARGIRTGFPALVEESERGARLKSHLRSETIVRGLPALLRHGDRNSMHFSVESRVPFLDRKLVEYVFSLPESELVGQDGASKSILRRAMRGIVPDEIIDRRDKVGFETPEGEWLSTGTRSVETISSATGVIGFLNGTATPGAGTEFGPGGRWRLLNLLRWAQLLDVDGS